MSNFSNSPQFKIASAQISGADGLLLPNSIGIATSERDSEGFYFITLTPGFFSRFISSAVANAIHGEEAAACMETRIVGTFPDQTIQVFAIDLLSIPDPVDINFFLQVAGR